MSGFRLSEDEGETRLQCNTCGHVCVLTEESDLVDVATAFLRLHPAHRPPAQHPPACPEGALVP